MCGIAGSIGKNIDVKRYNLVKLDETLNHRGPDHQNYLLQKNFFLYHARLSIID